jgi:hypothetical protein
VYGTSKAENMDEHLIKHHGFISGENVNTWLKIRPYGAAAWDAALLAGFVNLKPESYQF